MHIKKVNIKNFRSIQQCSIDLSDINVFYGSNDTGKSNLLKALNLFFNGKITHNENFNFDRDFCSFANTPNKKAKEISIEISLSPPKNYQDNNTFSWKKTWRENGLHTDSLSSEKTNGRAKKYSWAKKLKYKYIPALRDELYFSQLLIDLHSTLSSSINIELKSASSNLLSVIRKATEELSKKIQESLKIDSEIDLPSDLSLLFSALDFKTTRENHSVSIQNRGDGIKARHIPNILYFFHNEINSKNNKGSIKIDTIWGYEEPENNLEGLAAFDMAKQFIEKSKNIQILTTTHSPAFYLLKEDKNDKCNLIRVYQNNLSTNYVISDDTLSNTSYDEEFVAIVAPFIKKEKKRIEELNTKINSLTNRDNQHIIFVEGYTDKIIIDDFLKRKGKNDNVLVVDCNGCVGVLDCVISSIYNPKYNHKNKLYILGILDNDEAGKKEAEEFKKFKTYSNDVNRYKNKFKNNITMITLSSSLITTKLFSDYPITLESLFSPEKFTNKIKSDCFIDRDSSELNTLLSKQHLDIKKSLIQYIDETFQDPNLKEYLILKKINKEKKKIFADEIISIANNDIDIYKYLEENLQTFLTNIKN